MKNLILFNEFGAANDLGNEISDKVATFVNELIAVYNDVDLIQLKTVIDDTLGGEMAVARMTYSTQLRKAKKSGTNNV